MANAALLFSLAALLIFYIPSRRQKYFGIAGVIFLEAGFLLTLPKYFEEGNFFYPIIIVAALPFIYITVKRILTDNIHVKRFVNGTAVALLIYLPFAIIKPLGNWLIGTVVFWIQKVFDLIGFPYIMSDWNIFKSLWQVPGYLDGYTDEIILGCTGITAIAIILGVIFLTS
ncbi:MAG TPA: archaeosortase A, partial [Methanocorpusculum sp.]|nr:archaeosortase A [Methanocorpusculum sp.]